MSQDPRVNRARKRRRALRKGRRCSAYWFAWRSMDREAFYRLAASINQAGDGLAELTQLFMDAAGRAAIRP